MVRITKLNRSGINNITETLDRDGFAAVESIIQTERLSQLNSNISSEFQSFKRSKKWIGGGLILGHINCKPTFTPHLFDEDILFNKTIIKVLEKYFNSTPILISYTANINMPGSCRQSFHSDDRERKNDSINVSIPLLGTSLENGSTEVIPMTHKRIFNLRECSEDKHVDSLRWNLALGDCVFWIPNLWHRGTVNHSKDCRIQLNLRFTTREKIDTFSLTPMVIPYSTHEIFKKNSINAFWEAKDVNEKTYFLPNYFPIGLRGLIRELFFCKYPDLYESFVCRIKYPL